MNEPDQQLPFELGDRESVFQILEGTITSEDPPIGSMNWGQRGFHPLELGTLETHDGQMLKNGDQLKVAFILGPQNRCPKWKLVP